MKTGGMCAIANELQKVFHHKIALEKSDIFSDIELGKIVLYFSQEPQIKKTDSVSTQKKGYKEITYFMPNVLVNSSQVKQMITALNRSAQDSYSASIDILNSTGPGIELRIIFDPQKVKVDYDLFEPITRAKGLEIHLYNQLLLDTLEKKGQSVLRSASVKSPTVIIDCGHGGTDTGTMGFFNSVEKDLTLAIGKKLEDALIKQKIPVILTRNDDRFVALDERTMIANKCPNNAILVSLHANNAPNKKVRGLETFHLSSDLFKKEHAELRTSIDVLIDEIDSCQYLQSKKLAQAVHPSILKTMKISGMEIPDRKIRVAATQVLMGTKWPGILLELEYLSNEESAKMIQNSLFQQNLVSGICSGIQAYTNSFK